ncbi:unnamed protein product, partial [Schistosoma mattheei]
TEIWNEELLLKENFINGPPNLCQNGRHQSPINIMTKNLVYDHSLSAMEIEGLEKQVN